MTGRFITFEGGEGSGKTTQIRHLSTALRAIGRDVLETREPGGSPTAERIRSILLDPEERLDPVTQALLFSAARRDHVVTRIVPALERGCYVLSDRFADSTRAYQGAAGLVPAELIHTLIEAAIGHTVPDLTIVLDIDPEISLARAKARRGASPADAFEAATLSFHRSVRSSFLKLAEQEPERIRVIDASQSEDAIRNTVLKLVAERFNLSGLVVHG